MSIENPQTSTAEDADGGQPICKCLFHARVVVPRAITGRGNGLAYSGHRTVKKVNGNRRTFFLSAQFSLREFVCGPFGNRVISERTRSFRLIPRGRVRRIHHDEECGTTMHGHVSCTTTRQRVPKSPQGLEVYAVESQEGEEGRFEIGRAWRMEGWNGRSTRPTASEDLTFSHLGVDNTRTYMSKRILMKVPVLYTFCFFRRTRDPHAPTYGFHLETRAHTRPFAISDTTKGKGKTLRASNKSQISNPVCVVGRDVRIDRECGRQRGRIHNGKAVILQYVVRMHQDHDATPTWHYPMYRTPLIARYIIYHCAIVCTRHAPCHVTSLFRSTFPDSASERRPVNNEPNSPVNAPLV